MTTSLAIAGLREQLVPLAASPYVLEGGGMSALGQKLCSIRKRQRISRGSGRSPQWIIRHRFTTRAPHSPAGLMPGLGGSPVSGSITATTFPVFGSILLTGEAPPSEP